MIYHYDSATVIRIHDGDTIYVDLDMGLGMTRKDLGIRFAGINAPELSAADGSGKAALAFLETLAMVGDIVSIDSLGWDNYGNRIDARVFINGNPVSLGKMMLDSGHARPLGPYTP